MAYTRNPVLLSFLNGVTGVTVDNSSEKKNNAFTHIVEQIYYTRNLNIITPFSFRQNLVMHSSTHCKTAVQLNSYWESAQSYTKLCDILLQPAPPLICPTKSNVFNRIDNNQKIRKCGRRIKEGSKIPVSKCTTVGHIQTKPATFFQNDEKLSPKNWLGKS